MRYRDRLRVWESDWGRSDGWDLVDGRVVAVMDEPRWEDMFWMSYRVTPMTDDPALAAALTSEDFWTAGDYDKLVFRSRATGLVAEHAVPSGRPLVGPQRVNMRALYIPIGHPLPWDRIILRSGL
jgi:hypothetical protein